MNYKYLIIALFIGSLLISTSCNKTIEVEPQFVKDGSQIYKTLDEYEFALQVRMLFLEEPVILEVEVRPPVHGQRYPI